MSLPPKPIYTFKPFINCPFPSLLTQTPSTLAYTRDSVCHIFTYLSLSFVLFHLYLTARNSCEDCESCRDRVKTRWTPLIRVAHLFCSGNTGTHPYTQYSHTPKFIPEATYINHGSADFSNSSLHVSEAHAIALKKGELPVIRFCTLQSGWKGCTPVHILVFYFFKFCTSQIPERPKQKVSLIFH